MKVCQVWRSAIFSAPRWWKPMSGTTSTISSPSSCSDEAQQPVRAGVLRAEVQEHEVGAVARCAASPTPPGGSAAPPASRSTLRRRAARYGSISVARAGCSLRSGWPDPARAASGSAAGSGWPVEADAEHVPDFALVPVGVGPEVGDGRQRTGARPRARPSPARPRSARARAGGRRP